MHFGKKQNHMTCIASLIEEGSVWMAGDSARCSGQDLKIGAHPKVFRRQGAGTEWLFGCSGPARLSQVIQYELPLPTKKAPRGKALCGYLVKELVPLLRKTIAEASLLMKKEGSEKMMDGTIMCVVNGHIFVIDDLFFVKETRDKFATIGSGRSEAWGVLYATPRDTPERRLKMALSAAEATTTGVARPFNIIKIEGRK